MTEEEDESVYRLETGVCKRCMKALQRSIRDQCSRVTSRNNPKTEWGRNWRREEEEEESFMTWVEEFKAPMLLPDRDFLLRCKVHSYCKHSKTWTEKLQVTIGKRLKMSNEKYLPHVDEVPVPTYPRNRGSPKQRSFHLESAFISRGL
jgi:hypothetical protein